MINKAVIMEDTERLVLSVMNDTDATLSVDSKEMTAEYTIQHGYTRGHLRLSSLHRALQARGLSFDDFDIDLLDAPYTLMVRNVDGKLPGKWVWLRTMWCIRLFWYALVILVPFLVVAFSGIWFKDTPFVSWWTS